VQRQRGTPVVVAAMVSASASATSCVTMRGDSRDEQHGNLHAEKFPNQGIIGE
jgi:predicted small secreted protein